MGDIVPLLTAFGLGSIVTALVQAWLANRSIRDERRFKEKQDAYVGLLQAYHRCAMEGTKEAAKEFGYWQMRCELVAPLAVRKSIERIVETNDDQAGRAVAHENLKAVIRADLAIEK